MNLAQQRKQPTETIAPIESDPRLAPESAVLETLNHGETATVAEVSALKAEDYLGKPTTPRPDPQARTKGNKLRLNSRTADIEARLRTHRAKVPAKAEAHPGSGSATVAAALELILGKTRPSSKLARKELIQQLEADLGVIREAIVEQQIIVDAIRNELVAAQSLRDREAWNAIQLRKFRAMQQLAVVGDEEADFIASRISAGYVPFRSDLLPAIGTRQVLVVGSERVWDSPISMARRQLEEAKIL